MASTEPPNLRPRHDDQTTDYTPEGPGPRDRPSSSSRGAGRRRDRGLERPEESVLGRRGPRVAHGPGRGPPTGLHGRWPRPGLIEPAELGEYLARSGRTGRPSGAETLVRELVRDGRLTAYQAAAVLQGKTKGLVIGNYVVLDKVGAGSMGLVFKARHRRMNRVVGLKVLPPSFTMDRLAVLRFQREAQAAAHAESPQHRRRVRCRRVQGPALLRHGICRGTRPGAAGEAGGAAAGRPGGRFRPPGRARARRGARPGHHPPRHQAVEPAARRRGTVKVIDLGIARLEKPFGLPGGPAASAAELTCDGAMMGTLDYMSPEQAYNSKLADHRSDIYSLGCTLYYLLTGRVPFPAETLMALLLAHRERPVPSLRADLPDVPPALDAVVQRMMAKTPEARYPSMDALIVDLEACLAAPPDPSAAPTPLPPPAGQSDPNAVRIRPADLPSVPEAGISGSPVPPPRTGRPRISAGLDPRRRRGGRDRADAHRDRRRTQPRSHRRVDRPGRRRRRPRRDHARGESRSSPRPRIGPSGFRPGTTMSRLREGRSAYGSCPLGPPSPGTGRPP